MSNPKGYHCPGNDDVALALCWHAAFGAGSVLTWHAPTKQGTTAALIFSAALVMLFGISAMYHRVDWGPRSILWMQRLDHASIFVFIASSYTPFCILAPPSPACSALLSIVWIGAAAGVIKSLFWIDAPRVLTATLYLLLGWVVVFYGQEAIGNLGTPVLTLVVLGGISYSVGAVVYASRLPDPFPKTFGYHEIFHALVILAAFLHFIAIALLIQQAGVQPPLISSTFSNSDTMTASASSTFGHPRAEL